MTHHGFPNLGRMEWQATRESMKQYARVVGKVRRALAPPEKHWWHVALRMAASGATTGPIPGNVGSVELLLDFTNHGLVITTSHGQRIEQPLRGQSVAGSTAATIAAGEIHIEADVDATSFSDETF